MRNRKSKMRLEWSKRGWNSRLKSKRSMSLKKIISSLKNLSKRKNLPIINSDTEKDLHIVKFENKGEP
jgi:hypothetical protein